MVTPAQQALLPRNNTVNKTLDVYPNPANQFFVVYNYATNKKRSATLYDMNGRVIRQLTLSQAASRINVSELPAGLYILRITEANQNVIRTEKIVISH